MSLEEVYDVTIVGGGPTGLYTAFYAGMRDLGTKIIEYHPHLGGKLHVYLEKVIWDIGGLPPTTGERVVENLVEQGTTFDPTVVLGERVTRIERKAGVFEVRCRSGAVHLSRTVILALGYGVLNPKKLTIDGAEKFEVTNLYYTVGSLSRFRGKRVLISGGGNAAIDWANTLEPVAEQVTISHRREEFTGHERSILDLRASSVRTMTPYSIKELHAEGDEISSVSLENAATGEVEKIEVDAVIVNHGFDSDVGFIEENDFRRKGEYCIVVDEHMRTDIPGIFAAGDLVYYDGKLHLISGCFVEGATAVNSAKLYLEPEAEESAYVSSHNERFSEKNRRLELQGAIGGR
ncbi:NAD(P)/FAD-dependent oxidoreductase [Rubrobacter indicoceani]|uniref:NAD(P)/FAD-dependent oxidoreductase n=1 Tax=Rubrobacter indicoceani TaxID=2051957 RepID=UPI000E5A4A87|nr:NAD(P)/FAD-dependent oxidoreductase [Rubrobacter indicoceani]